MQSPPDMGFIAALHSDPSVKPGREREGGRGGREERERTGKDGEGERGVEVIFHSGIYTQNGLLTHMFTLRVHVEVDN